ncbi:MAG: DUF1553 domain-containing protein [Verrucomicrobiales bacterium]|nr:DUF1553 domain-containing protein [Verrucomicrobiales bacterium]
MNRRGVILFALLLLASPHADAETLSFRTSIIPVLTKAGCNAGACHGAATGQGGFKLSLLGYDPHDDHDRITRELGGRRLDLVRADDSLLLRKASNRIDHEGGRRLRLDSHPYELLKRWIEKGAPYGPAELHVAGIAVDPSDQLFSATNQTRQLRVVARLSDDTLSDVTSLSLFTSNDEEIAEVSATGLVRSVRPGLTAIMVRYSGHVAASRIGIPFEGPKVTANPQLAVNFVDQHIQAERQRLNVPASQLCSDEEFIRRIHLDLAGTLPEPEQVVRFLELPASPAKRAQVIEELLDNERFVDYWTLKMADLLLLNGKDEAATTYYRWLRNQIATRAPFDQWAQALLTATGDLAVVGPANFMTLAVDPRDLSEHVARIFLGTQIACARCHAHPSDQWTQEDYHRFAAYFARLNRDGGAIQISQRGEVDHPKTGQPLAPQALGAPPNKPQAEGVDRRVELAAWLTSPHNPRFTHTIVNRVWKHLLGRGLVEPEDDHRPTNPPSHPALLNALAQEFIQHRLDLRHLVRTIVLSETYQLSSQASDANRTDSKLYSHAQVRSLPAAVFVDAVAQVTGVPDVFPGYSPGTRAVQLLSPAIPSPALDILGRCQRKQSCGSPTQPGGGGLAQALHLINGSTINEKISGDRVARWLPQSDQEIILNLYLRAFARRPSANEMNEWNSLLSRRSDRQEAIQDLIWTVLNSREFSVNH